jgi:hypothetical protein
MGFKIDDDLFRHHPPHFRIERNQLKQTSDPTSFQIGICFNERSKLPISISCSSRIRLLRPASWAMPEDNLELALHMGGRERPPSPIRFTDGSGRKGSIKLGPVWSYPLKGAKK